MKIFRTKYKRLNYWLDVALIVAVLALVLFAFFWPVRITGRSLEPGLYNGDMVIASRFVARFGNLSQGDFVMARVSTNGRANTMVKRLAALPGDHVRISGDAVYVNNIELDWVFFGQSAEPLELALGENEYFLLGHDLIMSIDSRHFGPVPRRAIVSRVLLRYFPFNSFRIF